MNCLAKDNSHAEQLENGDGFFLGLSLQKDELDLVRSLVEAHWIDNIKRYAPDHYENFLDKKIELYHLLSHLVDHEIIWTKKNRILSQKSVDLIRSTSLMSSLEDIYGHFEISNEENSDREEIYWRLVRPHKMADAAPMHADGWFWELGHGITPPDAERVKVWIGLYCEPGLNGLCVVPKSHFRDWKYRSEFSEGILKPRIIEDVEKFPTQLIPLTPGEAIVFHDKLLHAGAVNKGKYTRVSIEFTMFVSRR